MEIRQRATSSIVTAILESGASTSLRVNLLNVIEQHKWIGDVGLDKKIEHYFQSALEDELTKIVQCEVKRALRGSLFKRHSVVSHPPNEELIDRLMRDAERRILESCETTMARKYERLICESLEHTGTFILSQKYRV